MRKELCHAPGGLPRQHRTKQVKCVLRGQGHPIRFQPTGCTPPNTRDGSVASPQGHALSLGTRRSEDSPVRWLHRWTSGCLESTPSVRASLSGSGLRGRGPSPPVEDEVRVRVGVKISSLTGRGVGLSLARGNAAFTRGEVQVQISVCSWIQ